MRFRVHSDNLPWSAPRGSHTCGFGTGNILLHFFDYCQLKLAAYVRMTDAVGFYDFGRGEGSPRKPGARKRIIRTLK